MRFLIYFLTFCFISLNCEAKDFPIYKWYKGDTISYTSLDKWKNEKKILLFWRSDCTLCLKEFNLLPKMAKEYSELTFFLISLKKESLIDLKNKNHFPNNLHILSYEDEPLELIKFYGFSKNILMLPYSIFMMQNRKYTQEHNGLLSREVLEKWKKL